MEVGVGLALESSSTSDYWSRLEATHRLKKVCSDSKSSSGFEDWSRLRSRIVRRKRVGREDIKCAAPNGKYSAATSKSSDHTQPQLSTTNERRPQKAQSATVKMPSAREQNQQGLYDVGMPIRRAVLGNAYVDRNLANGQTEFTKAMQEFTTADCWGAVWDRPGLERKQRSLINLSMLAATGKVHELAVHTRGAVNNGLSATEIREVLVQVCIYMGVPAGMEAFKACQKVLEDLKAEGIEVKQ